MSRQPSPSPSLQQADPQRRKQDPAIDFIMLLPALGIAILMLLPLACDTEPKGDEVPSLGGSEDVQVTYDGKNIYIKNNSDSDWMNLDLGMAGHYSVGQVVQAGYGVPAVVRWSERLNKESLTLKAGKTHKAKLSEELVLLCTSMKRASTRALLFIERDGKVFWMGTLP